MASRPSWGSKNMTEDEKWPKEARPSQFYDTIFKKMSCMKTVGSRPVGMSSSQGVFSYVYFKTQVSFPVPWENSILAEKNQGTNKKEVRVFRDCQV